MRNFEIFLGKSIGSLLQDALFIGWVVRRSVEKELQPPRIHYVFSGTGFEVKCGPDEIIDVIFINIEEIDTSIARLIVPINPNWTRKIAIEYYGPPIRSGGEYVHPILGQYGPWDIFDFPQYTLHFEYYADSFHVKRLTMTCKPRSHLKNS